MNSRIYAVLYACFLAILVGAIIVTASMEGENEDGPQAAPLVSLGSGFTYQGRLTDGGNPANGPHDFTFKLFDSSTGGAQVGSTITRTNQAVNNGLFVVSLDFGDGAYTGQKRWLEMAVRPAGVGAFTTILPRQELGPAPYAQSAPWFGVGDKPAGYDPVRSKNISSTLSIDSSAGFPPAVTIGADGLPVVVYHHQSTMRVSHCGNLDCSSSVSTTILTNTVNPIPAEITLGRDGLPVMVFSGGGNSGAIRVARCSNVLCTAFTLAEIDDPSTSSILRGVSIAIGSDGLPLISYMDIVDDVLKVAHCSNVLCTASVITSFDSILSTGVPPVDTSVTIGADGLGVIAYVEYGAADLKVAHCENLACTSATLTLIDAFQDVSSVSIATGTDGLGLIAYNNSFSQQLKVAHCENPACSTFTVTNLGTGVIPSLVIGPDGLGLIAYKQATGELKLATCKNIECTGAALGQPFPATEGFGTLPSITWGIDGLPVIAYVEGDEVRLLHCGSPTCVNYSRPR